MSPPRLGTPECRALVSLMDEGIVVHDAQGRVLECSPAAALVLGVPAGEMVGRSSLFEGLSPVEENGDRMAPEAEPAREAIAHGEPARPRNVRFALPGGEVRWVSIKAGPLLTPRGRTSGAITVLLDLTHRKALERDLHGSVRMEAIGRLAGSVAHDFNNWLTAIFGYNEILLDNLDPGDPRRREAEEVQKAAQSAAGLTRQLLAFSRGQVLDPLVLDLNRVLRSMHDILGRLLGEDVVLNLDLAGDLSSIKADRGQLEQVVLNLVINARDAMKGDGEVRIRTRNAELDLAFEVSHAGSRAGRYVLLSVHDDGCGMDATTLSHIFEPFFTTKPSDRGTGLGLATVFGIVKQSGGYIDVHSSPGEGSRFDVYLPACDERPQPPPPSLLQREAPPLEATVLLVEDNAQVRALARGILEGRGMTVLEEADGLRALTVLDHHAGAIDMLLTDLALPGLRGSELARYAVARRPGIRVLLTSGHMEAAHSLRDAGPLGAHFLAKPFEADTLVEKITQVMTVALRR